MSEEHQEQDVDEPEGEEQEVLQTVADETEVKARDKGWRPQEEWAGQADAWLPAEEYLKRGGYKDRARKAEERVSELEKQVASHGDTVKRLERMSDVALKQQRKQLETDYASKKREAVKLGDEDAYDKAERDEKKALDDLDKEHAEVKPKESATKGLPPATQAKLETWVEDNDWFKTNPRLRRHAERFYDDVDEDMPAASVEDKLAEVRERMVEAYPKEFGVKKTNGAARVESGSRVSGGGESRSLYSKLPADAKAQADKFIDEGLFIRPGETVEKNRAQARERYAKEYLETP